MIKGKMNVVIKRNVNKDGLCGNDLYPYSFFFLVAFWEAVVVI